MKCEICRLGPADGLSVYRVNPKGQEGIWRCKPHLGSSAPIAPEVAAIAEAIEGPSA